MWKKLFNNSSKTDAIPAKEISGSISDNLDREKLPRHVAIIMDGNGRWAQAKGLVRTAGHKAGVNTLHNVVLEASRLGLEALTVYAFSTENWSRPNEEVSALMLLLRNYMKTCIKTAKENNMRVRIIGDKSRLDADLQKSIAELEEASKNHDGLFFQVAINYGSQDEMLRAVNRIIQDKGNNKISGDITKEIFEEYLDTAGTPMPDLLIRTSGEQRLSNFLLWQLAYAEFYFTDVHWPDFSEKELEKAVMAYNGRDRRYGAV